MKKSVLTILACVLLSGLTAYAVSNASGVSSANSFTAAPDGSSYRTVNLSETDYPDFTYAAETAVDAVVFVKVTIKTRQEQMMMDPFLQFFFGQGGMQPQEREQQGSGSGVIIRPDGYIVTNNHVVAGATKVEVTLNNNQTYEAKVIGTDSATDVALLKIEADGLPTVKFADSDRLRLGEWVIAIGSPYNLRSTITAGIVSAKGRSMNNTGEFKIESFIQTDAAVNPGNSGGALVNKKGELVGINTMIYSQTGSYSGYSFAVPSNIVSKIVGDLIDFGSVKRAKLGIAMQEIDEKRAKELKLSSIEGVYIGEVVKGGAADKAGIKEGDVLLAIDDTRIKGAASVQEKVNSFHPGDNAVATISRNGKEMQMNVQFQGVSDETGTVNEEDGTTAFYGAKLRAADKGVEIVSAGSGKLAQAGGEDGFIIQYVNDQPVRKPQDVVDIAKKTKRAIFIEGVTATGRSAYFGFGKDE